MDEEMKNHKSIDSAITSSHIPEIVGNNLCPIQIYVTYTQHLSPKSESLWQMPKFTDFPLGAQQKHI